MSIQFEKYQGAGNDFVILEKSEVERCVSQTFPLAELVRSICKPHYGVSADGLFVVWGQENDAWRISFYNCDGGQATMCGNGARCVSAYLFSRMPRLTELTLALGELRIPSTLLPDGRISLQMPVDETFEWLPVQGGYLINTGVPHLVLQCQTLQELDDLDLVAEARPLRYEVCGTFGGVNVDFYCLHEGQVSMRTYERGVEGETRACGTGAVAVALVAAAVHNLHSPQTVNVLGGTLSVAYQMTHSEDNGEFLFHEVRLTGDAVLVARGEYFHSTGEWLSAPSTH